MSEMPWKRYVVRAWKNLLPRPDARLSLAFWRVRLLGRLHVRVDIGVMKIWRHSYAQLPPSYIHPLARVF